MNPQEESLTDSLAFLLAQQGQFDYAVRGLDLWLSDKRTSVETDLITVRWNGGRRIVACIETKVHTNRDGKRNRLVEQIRIREDARIFDEIWVAWDTDDVYMDHDIVAGQGTIFIDHVAANSPMPTAKIVQLVHAPQRQPTQGRAWESLEYRLRQMEDCGIFSERAAKPPVFVRCPGCNGSGSFYYAFRAPPVYQLKARVHAPFCVHNPNRVRYYEQFIASVDLVQAGATIGSLVRTGMVRL